MIKGILLVFGVMILIRGFFVNFGNELSLVNLCYGAYILCDVFGMHARDKAAAKR